MTEEVKKSAPKKYAGVKKPRAPRVKKTAPAKAELPKPEQAPERPQASGGAPAGEYFYGLGRRKEAIALVRVYKKGTGRIFINDRAYTQYFPRFDLQRAIQAPLATVGQTDMVDVSAHVHGGGLRGQAEAVRLGIARALLKQNETFRVGLKRNGFLKRDPRVKERKKYGLKKARRAPQWSKR